MPCSKLRSCNEGRYLIDGVSIDFKMCRAIPLLDGNEVIGCIIVAESLDAKEKLIDMAQNLI